MICRDSHRETEGRCETQFAGKTHGSRERQRMSDWQDLRSRFFDMLGTKPAAAHTVRVWTDVWRLFVTHRCYLDELDKRARWVLFATKSRFEWLDDVKQDAVLILASKLKRRIDLNVNTALAERCFVAWLRCLVTHHCSDALRELRRQNAHQRPLPAAMPACFVWQAIDERLDFEIAAKELLEPDRTILVLSARGYAIDHIRARSAAEPTYDVSCFLSRTRHAAASFSAMNTATVARTAFDRETQS